MRYIDLFAGVGGFGLGIKRATNEEWKCVAYYEKDKYAVQTYNKNFNTNYNPTDITKLNTDDIPDFDLLCAGFPCQSFSIAGKRRGFEDVRGTMFFEIARILKAKRPSYFLLENVKGLLNHDKGKTFSVILQTLDELGYEFQWMVLNSKFFGVAQNRERVFIIGNIRGISRPEILPFGENSRDIEERNEQKETESQTLTATYHKGGKGTHIKMAIKSDREIGRVYSPDGVAPTLHIKTGGWQEPKIAIRDVTQGDTMPTLRSGGQGGVPSQRIAIPILTPDREEKRQHGRRFKEDGEPSFTLTGQDVHGVAILRGRPQMPYEHGKRKLKYSVYADIVPTLSQSSASGDQKNIVLKDMQIRRLTPTECLRLQGFPDDFFPEGLSDTQRYKQMGNAVTTNVITAIIRKLKGEIK